MTIRHRFFNQEPACIVICKAKISLHVNTGWTVSGSMSGGQLGVYAARYIDIDINQVNNAIVSG